MSFPSKTRSRILVYKIKRFKYQILYGLKYYGEKILARIRYRQPLEDAVFHLLPDQTVSVSFSHAQRAVAPGQFIAFYKENELLGSGVIS